MLNKKHDIMTHVAKDGTIISTIMSVMISLVS